MTDRPHRSAPPGRPRAGSPSPVPGAPPFPGSGAPPSPAATGSKTIDTGLRLLEILRDHPDGLTISELARTADVHRNAVSRHLTALRNHRLVSRTGTRYTLGLGIVELGAAVQHRLRAAAEGALQSLADGCRATAFISVLDADEEVVVLAVAEPRGSDFHVAYRAGKRHAVDHGAPGIAILAGRPPRPRERPIVREARRTGYAVTEGELQPGAWGVAAPIVARGRPAQASIGVVTIGAQDESAIAPRVVAASGEIARLL
ncbi:IclR family transcriptional regulator [Actinoallomurus rhizosphaericola]|uniref:IclR family transcriptional regulator n=1 Tax=Actinoallomurus rhizosphaericola TaxID=2952536 RepID=UPI002092BE53|nr:helix-turn-helix domain-containing protein [Actinoallomurus rhizosphaericola]MCO5999719.1 helix-turn-helix domain-containing protein [Actinoallomurus rhizosphaericola]